jgi:MFS family permease
MQTQHSYDKLTKRKAIRFVILMGLISLFADMTYEGARSIAGPYIAILGASGLIVGFVAGFGEFAGYALRLPVGYISDRTRFYWTITFIGYMINLLTVPLLALAHQWQIAASLLILERFGKAIRTPSRDAMLSYAAHTTGRGWGFGLHEAMDQMGAMLGPLLVAAVLYFHHSYSLAFALLLFPALVALILLAFACWTYPQPRELEVEHPTIKTQGFEKSYWLFVVACCLIAAGYVDFPLIAYHFEREKIAPAVWIPIVYAVAMGVEGLTALILGRWFDRQGMIVLIFSTACSAFLAPFTFLGDFAWAIIGLILWGIGMGAQGSVMRAVVAHLIGRQQRATAFGMFNLWFGIFWFAGSALIGYLYDVSLTALISFSVLIQLTSLPILWMIKRVNNDS